MGITSEGAAGSAQQINDMSAAITIAETALAPNICFPLNPRCLTSTPALSNRFMETYANEAGISLTAKLPTVNGADAQTVIVHNAINGTITEFAAISPEFPLPSKIIDNRHTATPAGIITPVSSANALSVPAIIAASTITAFTVITTSAAFPNLPNSVRWISVRPPVVFAPTKSTTAVNANISNPQKIGTKREGDQPKNDAISCPLEYPAPIIVPTLTIATPKTFFTFQIYVRSRRLMYFLCSRPFLIINLL